jgi:hypothetical protein
MYRSCYPVQSSLEGEAEHTVKLICIIAILTAKLNYVRFEAFTAVTMRNAVFCDVAPCISCLNRRFGGTYRLPLHGRKIREQGTSMSRWLQTVRACYFRNILLLVVNLLLECVLK